MFASLHVAFVAGFDNVVSSTPNTHFSEETEMWSTHTASGSAVRWPPNTPPKSICQENGQQKLDLGKRTGRGPVLGKRHIS